jgi:hypothetical protein
MRWKAVGFGLIEVDGVAHEQDVVLDGGRLRRRRKKPSKAYRGEFGHTPVSVREEIPWKCERLVIATGMDGRLPVMDDVRMEAERRAVKLVVLPTPEAVEILSRAGKRTNAIVHVTC